MKTVILFAFLIFTGMFIIPGCGKQTLVNVPVSFTDKAGNIFIKIDTLTKRFDAYSTARISKGHFNGVFNDTIRSSFYLAIISDPFWDSTYHDRDTLVLPTHYTGHIVSIQADIDLTDFSSPYHFMLWGMSDAQLKCGPHGIPSILITVATGNE